MNARSHSLRLTSPLYRADYSQLGTYLVLAALSIGNLLLPMVLHQIPQAGPTFLPMFVFTLLGASLFGPLAGIVIGLSSPLLNHLVTGMPVLAVLPVLLAKSTVLALTAGLLVKVRGTIGLGGLLAAVALMQASGLGLDLLRGLPFQAALDAILKAWPAYLLMGPGVLAVLLLFGRLRPEDQP